MLNLFISLLQMYLGEFSLPEQSISILGTAAVTALLQGAKKAKTDTHDFSKYVKRGNLDTAWRDFKSVNPTDIRKKRVGGGVGFCFTLQCSKMQIR